MTNLLTPEESDAVAVINAAIKRNAAMASDLEAEANGHENQAGEARLRATAYRDANENLTKQLELLNGTAPAPADVLEMSPVPESMGAKKEAAPQPNAKPASHDWRKKGKK